VNANFDSADPGFDPFKPLAVLAELLAVLAELLAMLAELRGVIALSAGQRTKQLLLRVETGCDCRLVHVHHCPQACLSLESRLDSSNAGSQARQLGRNVGHGYLHRLEV
jgi:hypothetical protein